MRSEKIITWVLLLALPPGFTEVVLGVAVSV